MESVGYFKGKYGDIKVNLTIEAAEDIEDCWGAIVIPFYQQLLIMAYHPARDGWEFPGGRREPGESVMECAVRETYEETGALLADIIPVGYYRVVLADGQSVKTAICSASVESLAQRPEWSEMGEVKTFEELPENLSFKDGVYEFILKCLK